jgi:hypothetical protein
VKRSIVEWRQAGVHLIVGDVLAPPHMQTAAAFETAAGALYGWLADNVSRHTPLLLTYMAEPGPQRFDRPGRPLTSDWGAYRDRFYRAFEIADDAGLAYAHSKQNPEDIVCHNCEGLLLRVGDRCDAGLAGLGLTKDACTENCGKHFCPFYFHEQHVTGGRCDHCGTEVPIVVGDRRYLAKADRVAADDAASAGLA